VLLCVERDPHVRELQRFFLEQAGYQVAFADDGLQALDLARELRPAGSNPTRPSRTPSSSS
jgi:CheY-like chemotaxis protein